MTTTTTVSDDLRTRIDAYVTEANRVQADYNTRCGYTLPPDTHAAEYLSEKWCKIVTRRPGGSVGGSVHSFVALADFETKALGQVKRGDIHKAASWKAPAKHARGSVFAADFGKCLTPFGVRYL